MPTNDTERSYYPSGLLRWEGSFRDDKLNGKNRHWHENGQLSKETFYENGLENGVATQWNNGGKMLGQYSMDHGTGVERKWYESGQLEREAASVHGKLCGRFCCWYEDGKQVSTSYYIMDKKVSKKKYDEACKSDPTLPRYEDDEPKLKSQVRDSKRIRAQVSEIERKDHDEFIQKFRADPSQAEARQWLASDGNRNIGEMTPEGSREFIEEGYKAGATKILAVEIQDETTNCLVVELPLNGVRRQRVFAWNNQNAQGSGFDPDEDWGQKEVFVYFS